MPVALILLALMGCASTSLNKDRAKLVPDYAQPPAAKGILSELANQIMTEHGEEHSGFMLLDGSFDGLYWRLALIDSATTSLDIQTYLWYPDFSGKLILDRAVRAADRGVKVRLIVDDLLTIGLDQVLFELAQHPNIDFRLFNPWEERGTLNRAGAMIAEMERLNTRMHDKLLIADGNAAVVGGRNQGDHYFGLSDAYNFHDLDLVGFGHIARQANGMFDHFWNSDWVASSGDLILEHSQSFAQERLAAVRAEVETAPELSAFPRLPKDWESELGELMPLLHPGTSYLIYDQTLENEIDQLVARELFGLMGLAREELLITNAYIIPGQPAIDFISALVASGVDVRILTNSLASHDVPAVNSHYRGWRDDFINAGARLFEFRADASVAELVNVPPVRGEFVGLHTKSFVVDRRYAFIGSMNFDPRSININTEAGAFVESEGLAQDLAQLMLRDMRPDNAWEVIMEADGSLYWINSDERTDRQPARNSGQRIMDRIFEIFPKEQY